MSCFQLPSISDELHVLLEGGVLFFLTSADVKHRFFRTSHRTSASVKACIKSCHE